MRVASAVLTAVSLLQAQPSPPGFMLGAAALSGRVLLPNGDPPPRLLINALRRVTQPDGRVLTKMGQSERLDPDGRYRFPRLPPGDYIIVARPQSPELAAKRLPDGRIAFAPTYYPGTPDPAAALFIHVSANESIGDIDFTIGPGPAYSVSGVVIDVNGTPVSPATVTLSSSVRDMVGGPMPPVFAPTRPDGTFTLEPVAKGVYTIVAVRLMRSGRRDFGVVVLNGERFAPAGLPARLEVSVGDNAVAGVRLVIPADR